MYSVLVHCYSRKEKNTARVYEDTQRKEMKKIEIDGQEKAEISVGAGRKRKEDKEERDLEERLMHFYGSRTHYLLIRAHTYFSVRFNMRAWQSKLLF